MSSKQFSLEELKIKAKRNIYKAINTFPDKTVDETMYLAKRYAMWDMKDARKVS